MISCVSATSSKVRVMRYAWWVVPRKDFVMPETGYTVGWQGRRCHLVPSPEGHRVLDIVGGPEWAMGVVEDVLNLPSLPGHTLHLGWYGMEEGGLDCIRIFPFFLAAGWVGSLNRMPRAARGRFEVLGAWEPVRRESREWTAYDRLLV